MISKTIQSNVMIGLSLIALAGCQSTQDASSQRNAPASALNTEDALKVQPPAGPLHQVADDVIDPVQAIVYAAQSAPDGYPGRFGFTVRNADRNDYGIVYLNSEENYREQINISVQIHPDTVNNLAARYGRNWVNEVIGKSIEVDGRAMRRTIYFGDKETQEKPFYYYQTHIYVTDPNKLKIL